MTRSRKSWGSVRSNSSPLTYQVRYRLMLSGKKGILSFPTQLTEFKSRNFSKWSWGVFLEFLLVRTRVQGFPTWRHWREEEFEILNKTGIIILSQLSEFMALQMSKTKVILLTVCGFWSPGDGEFWHWEFYHLIFNILFGFSYFGMIPTTPHLPQVSVQAVL